MCSRRIAPRRRAAIAAAAVAALTLASGCGSDEPEYGGQAPAHSAMEPHETAEQEKPVKVDLLAARDAVLREYPGSLVHDVDLEEDDQVWTVEFTYDGYERDALVDAVSGKVSQNRDLPHDDNDRPSWDMSALPEDSLDTAVAAALKELRGDRVVDASLGDDDKGRLFWKIEVDDPDPVDAGTETTVTVDAQTGKVVETET